LKETTINNTMSSSNIILSNNIREIHMGDDNDLDNCTKLNPSVKDDEKYCYDDDYETNRISSMENMDNNNSTELFATPRPPWYGTTFVHWLDERYNVQ